MRNLLQNKMAVALLLAVALGLAGNQLNLFSGSGVLVIAGREAAEPEPSENDDGEPVVTNTPPRYLAGLHDWQQMLSSTSVRRDPFQPLQSASTKTDTRVAASTAPTRMNLQAISRHDQRRFAVVDGVVVGEGDRLAEFKVAKIQADSVLLSGPEGTERKLELRFDDASDPLEQPTDEDSNKTSTTPAEAEPK